MNRTLSFVLPFLLLAFSGCAIPNEGYGLLNPTPQIRDRNATEAVQAANIDRAAIKAKSLQPYTIAEAEAAVRTVLRDPESGRFRESRRNPTTGAVCGFVNGKNAYGGYVGESPFVYYFDPTRQSPQVLMGQQIAVIATLPYTAAFCASGETVSEDSKPISAASPASAKQGGKARK